MRVYVCVRACVYLCARLFSYVCACAHACVYVCVCMYLCARVRLAAPQMLQWCAWRCAGVAFADAGVRICCCCCSLSAKRTGASMVPQCQLTASTHSARQAPAPCAPCPTSTPSQHGLHFKDPIQANFRMS